MEQIRSADVLANFPQVDEEKLNAALAAEAAESLGHPAAGHLLDKVLHHLELL